jgi:hypothetical protein
MFSAIADLPRRRLHFLHYRLLPSLPPLPPDAAAAFFRRRRFSSADAITLMAIDFHYFAFISALRFR